MRIVSETVKVGWFGGKLYPRFTSHWKKTEIGTPRYRQRPEAYR